jgi:predicted esterase
MFFQHCVRFLSCSIALCAFVSVASAQTDLAPLFAPPTTVEIEAVRADWNTRDLAWTDWSIIDESTSSGHRIQLVRYVLGGDDLYAMLRFPRNESSPVWPVMLWHHGGTSGLDADDLLTFDADHTGDCLADSFLVIAPTYRSEAFRGGSGLTARTSEGAPSPFDRDADDAMALLNAVLDNMPQASPTLVRQWGRSRGANVAWHVTLRDQRVVRTTAYFAPTDFRYADIQSKCQQAEDTGVPSTDSLAKRVMSFIVEPWLAGTTSLAEARHQLTAWSVLPFLDSPLAVQIHHGESDDRVPVVHGQDAVAALVVGGAVAPEFAAYFYPGGSHGMTGLAGHADRTEDYLCSISVTTGITIRPTVDSLTIWPNPTRGRVVFSLRSDAVATVEYGIFDVVGRKVGQVMVPPGDQVGWSAYDKAGRVLPSGLYLARRVDGSAPASRFLLMR